MTASHTSPIPWALVGFGSGGRVFHAPLLASAPELSVVAVVTSNPARRAQAAEALPDVPAANDLAAAAALGARGVTISTPPATHLPLALAAIDLGLNVVVDKPFAVDAGESRRIADAAASAGVQVFPYFNRRFDDDFRTVRDLVQGGRLGTVHRFESRLDRSRPVKPGWSSDPTRGGGLLLDLGPHLVDQALCLLGPVASITARLDTVRDGATAEDTVMIDLRHVSGARSLLTASLAAPVPGPRFLVQGSEAGIRIEGFDVQEAQLKAGASPKSLGAAWGVDPGRFGAWRDSAGHEDRLPLLPGGWNLFYPAVAAAMAEAAAPPTSPGDAIVVAELLDAARRSSAEGCTITVN